MRKNELISLSSKSIIKKYQSRIYLIKQNEEANCIFFIKSGLVQVKLKKKKTFYYKLILKILD